MLETIREYGLERLEESGEAEAAGRRHADYYLMLAEEAARALRGPHQMAWCLRLEHDHDNLRAALAFVHDRADAELGLRLVAALWRFWSARGHAREGRQWLRQVLLLSEGRDEPAAVLAWRARALTGAALLALEVGVLSEAATASAAGLALARAYGEPADLVDALNARGMIGRVRAEYAEATASLEEALAVAMACGYQDGEAAALAELGMVRFLTGELGRGQALIERSLTLYRELGDTRGLASVLSLHGWIAGHAGDAARGDALRVEALELFRALGDAGQVAETLWSLAISAQTQGNYARATALHEESLALHRARGDERGVARVLSALGGVALHQRDLEAARGMLTEVLPMVRRLDDRWSQAMALALLGHVELVAGDLVHAEQYLRAAAELHMALGNPLYLSWCFEGLAGVAAARGRLADAARLLGVRDALQERVGPGLQVADPAGYAQTLAAVRTALGEDTFATEVEAGRALTPQAALAGLAGEP
jgi:tetratricopeptide (TPR) repeat protein